MKQLSVILVLVFLISCGSRKNAPTENASEPASAAAVPNYSPRIGVAVSTASRTCVAIANPNLTANTPTILVSPLAPQSYMQGEITGPSKGQCPVFENVEPGFYSYDIHLAQDTTQKLTPLIALVGPMGSLALNNGNVTADLDANNKTQYFRACSATNAIHLTVWSGTPLTSTLLWHGSYYAPNNPGLAPPCGPKEMMGL